MKIPGVNFDVTMRNIRSVLRRDDYMYAARLEEKDGFTAKISHNNKQYFILFDVDKSIGKLIIQLYPGICCPIEYQGQVSAYINKANSYFKDGQFKINKRGEVFSTCVISFADSSAEVRTIDENVHLLLDQCSLFDKVIDKLAHGQLAEPQEYDIDAIFQSFCNKKKLQSLMKSEFYAKDDDEDSNEQYFTSDDDDYDEDADDDEDFDFEAFSESIKNLMSFLDEEDDDDDDEFPF